MKQLVHIDDATTAALPNPVAKATSLTGQHETTLTAWSEGAAQAGVWECDPGEFTTSRDGFHEVCQILSGSGTMLGEDGQKVELAAGSTIVIPDGWSGTWTIHETMRKTYVNVPSASVSSVS